MRFFSFDLVVDACHRCEKSSLRARMRDFCSAVATRSSLREFVLMIAKASEPAQDSTSPEEAVALLVGAGVDRMEAMKTVARERGLSKRDVYKLVNVPKLK